MSDQPSLRGRGGLFPALRGHALAVVSVALATLGQGLLRRYVDDSQPFFAFYLAVLVSAWYAGLGPALLSLGLGSISAAYFFVPVPGLTHLVGLTLFFFAGLTIALLTEALHRARRKAEKRQGAVEAEAGERELVTKDISVAERKFRRLATYAPVGIFETDAAGDCLFVNEKWSQIAGLSPQAALGRGWLAAIHPQDRERVFKEWYEASRSGREFAAEYRFQTPQGKVTWVYGSAVSLRAEGSTGYIGMVVDINERKLAEETRSRLAAIVDSSDDAIISKTLQGIITTWNAGAQRIFGYTAEEVIGRSISILLPPGQEDEELRILDRICHGERIDHFETVRVSKDGSLVLVSLTISPIKDSTGKTVGASKIARDITSRKRAEEVRKELLAREHAARKDAERANQMKDEFLATLSHELRTPLNAILGWATLLRTGKMGENESTHGLEVIERNARNQAQLIEDLLDMSRIISGKVRLDVQPIELVPIVEAALEAVDPAVKAKAIQVRREFDPQVGMMLGDPTRLQQVVWNLLSNAIKFTPRGGEVRVQLRFLGSHVEIVVSDTGLGIKPEFLPHVFDRFRQADASTTRHHGGLGLGLAIVRHLVEDHGGTVHAHSEGEGKGATFKVVLPVVVELPEIYHPRPIMPSRENAPRLSPQRLKGIKVLVVDDEPDAQDLIRKLLEDHEAEVATAGSTGEALEILKRYRPNILVSDIGMPVEDGYALIRRVRTFAPELPAVALTAYAGSEYRRRALESGFQAHVPKPVEGSELVSVVADLASTPLEGSGPFGRQ